MAGTTEASPREGVYGATERRNFSKASDKRG
jgi:hypothetical protein